MRGSFGGRGLRTDRMDAPLALPVPRSFACCAPISLPLPLPRCGRWPVATLHSHSFLALATLDDTSFRLGTPFTLGSDTRRPVTTDRHLHPLLTRYLHRVLYRDRSPLPRYFQQRYYRTNNTHKNNTATAIM